MVGVTLVSREGYFRQHLDLHGRQTESPETWEPSEHATVPMDSHGLLVALKRTA